MDTIKISEPSFPDMVQWLDENKIDVYLTKKGDVALTKTKPGYVPLWVIEAVSHYKLDLIKLLVESENFRAKNGRG